MDKLFKQEEFTNSNSNEKKEEVKYIKISELTQDILNDVAKIYKEVTKMADIKFERLFLPYLKIEKVRERGSVDLRVGSSLSMNSKFKMSYADVPYQGNDFYVKFWFDPNIPASQDVEKAKLLREEFDQRVAEYLTAKFNP